MTSTPTSQAPATLAELTHVIHDESLPLIARVEAARRVIGRLESVVAEHRAVVTQLVQERPLDPDTLATLYWEFEDLVPTSLLGNYQKIREIVESRCPWTYPCPDCGTEQPIGSRTALKQLQRAMLMDAPEPWRYNGAVCGPCGVRRSAGQREAHMAQWEARQARVRQLRTMPYREYLQTPEWQERRKARLKVARYRCQVCNRNDRRLNVHHRTYERRGEEFARDLIVLCEPCHHLFHQNGALAPHDHD